MSKPVAVLISDVHYSVRTMDLADAAMKQAIEEANELGVPLVVCGDIHDTKANLRGECVNAMIKRFKLCNQKPYVIVGNHDKINEKSEEHSLNFLEPYATIVEDYLWVDELNSMLISYQHDTERLKQILKNILPETRIIMHQGVEDSHSGEYIQDKTALTKECFKDFRVISGHYHRRQDIKCGRPRQGATGLFSYVGNPYTVNFAEADDPPKGFQILMENGLLEFVPTNLRKHVVLKRYTDELIHLDFHYIESDDLVWIKIEGPKEELVGVNKEYVRAQSGITQDFRLELIPIDTEINSKKSSNFTQPELLDNLIDSLTNTSDDRKSRLKDMWRKAVCG